MADDRGASGVAGGGDGPAGSGAGSRSSAHAEHDPLVVAEAADRGGRLPASLADCPDCRALHADLVALAAAIPSAALPIRPRDYRLTPADAARLRSTGWRRWLTAIGTSRDTITRPLAIGFTTLGLAGLLVATVPSVLPAGDAGANAPAAAPAEGAESVGGAAPPAPEAGDEEAGDSAVDDTTMMAGASPEPDAAKREALSVEGGASPLTALSIAMVVVGAGLFAARRLAARGARAP